MPASRLPCIDAAMRHGLAEAPEPPGTSIAALAERLARERFVWFFADLGQLPVNLTPATSMEEAEAQSRPPGLQRNGFLARRRLTRHVLAEALALPSPDRLRIGSDPFGRPVVLQGTAGWHLSFAARERLALIAIAGHPVGVDFEREEPDLFVPVNILQADERSWLKAQPENLKIQAFCRIWTAKEAIAKALGTGFRIPPENIDLPVLNGRHVDIRISARLGGSETEKRSVQNMLVLTREGIRVFVSRPSGEAQGGLAGICVTVACARMPGPANPDSG